MNNQQTDASTDLEVERDGVLPRHPFFEIAEDPASFIDCVDAIDRVNAIIERCDFLKLGDDGDSSANAVGYYWVTLLTGQTLSYVSNRLLVLNKQTTEKHRRESTYLAALCRALPALGRDNRERLLNKAAAQMNITRSAVDEFINTVVVK